MWLLLTCTNFSCIQVELPFCIKKGKIDGCVIRSGVYLLQSDLCLEKKNNKLDENAIGRQMRNLWTCNWTRHRILLRSNSRDLLCNCLMGMAKLYQSARSTKSGANFSSFEAPASIGTAVSVWMGSCVDCILMKRETWVDENWSFDTILAQRH